MKTFFHRSFEDQAVVSQKMKSRDLCLFAMAILAFWALVGCAAILSPNEDQRWEKTAPIFFAGGVKDPNVKITIQAWAYDHWEDIPNGQFISDSKKWPDWGAIYAYPWFGWLTIPAKHWGSPPGCAMTGVTALVRAKLADENYLFAARGLEPWMCYWAHPFDDFYKYCGSSFPGAEWVRAKDYHDFGKECADKINEIRKNEGIKALLTDENEECEADCDAQCNYEWELGGGGTHHCKPWEINKCNLPLTASGFGQNECAVTTPYANGSIDDILNGCIQKQMYENEKKCYQANKPSVECPTGETPDGCYKDKNCPCGHYLNMVKCPFTKVSCGLYETPNGLFKSVQNFWW